MLTLVPPVLVRVTVCDCWDPVVTLPNASAVGFRLSWPGPIPEPERPRVTDGFDASLVTVAVPLNDPAAFGENITLNVALWPDAIVTGRLGAVREKYLLETATPLTVIELGPEFVAKTERVLVLDRSEERRVG